MKSDGHFPTDKRFRGTLGWVVCCSLLISGALNDAARGSDLIALRDGQELRGELEHPSFTLRSAYGGVKLETRFLRSIELAFNTQGLAQVSTINSNQLIGFIEDETLPFKTDAGTRTNLRSGKIATITLGTNINQTQPAHLGWWLALKQGDLLSGKLVTDPISVVGTNGHTQLKPEEIETLTMTADGGLSCSIARRNGAVIQRTLQSEFLVIDLDLGGRIQLYAGTVQVLSDSYATVTASTHSGKAPPLLPWPALGSGSVTNLPDLVWIAPGDFLMGSNYNEKGRDPDEGPQTKVIIPQGFWMGRYEVTQAEYEKVIGINPSTSTESPSLPVEKVNWSEAMEYCAKLTELAEKAGVLPENHMFRLPTEAEWEYACRAGSTGRFSCEDDLGESTLEQYAWFAGNSEFRTHPVGAKKPNPWGLYDMHGNVWEWCLDRWDRTLRGGAQTNTVVIPSGGLRVARGGSWLYDAKACRSANRDDYSPSNRCSDIGFRIVLAPVQP